MNRFFGRNNESRKGAVFQKSDRYMVALNFENLCDPDYVAKLFIMEQSTDQEQCAQQVNAHQQKGSTWLPTPDTPEEILLFGDAMELGTELILKQTLYSVPPSLKCPDLLSNLVFRQACIFRRISQVVLKDYVEISRSRKDSAAASASDSLSSAAANGHSSNASGLNMAGDALFCSLSVLARKMRKISSSAGGAGASKMSQMRSLNSYLRLLWSDMADGSTEEACLNPKSLVDCLQACSTFPSYAVQIQSMLHDSFLSMTRCLGRLILAGDNMGALSASSRPSAQLYRQLLSMQSLAASSFAETKRLVHSLATCIYTVVLLATNGGSQDGLAIAVAQILIIHAIVEQVQRQWAGKLAVLEAKYVAVLSKYRFKDVEPVVVGGGDEPLVVDGKAQLAAAAARGKSRPALPDQKDGSLLPGGDLISMSKPMLIKQKSKSKLQKEPAPGIIVTDAVSALPAAEADAPGREDEFTWPAPGAKKNPVFSPISPTSTTLPLRQKAVSPTAVPVITGGGSGKVHIKTKSVQVQVASKPKMKEVIVGSQDVDSIVVNRVGHSGRLAMGVEKEYAVDTSNIGGHPSFTPKSLSFAPSAIGVPGNVPSKLSISENTHQLFVLFEQLISQYKSNLEQLGGCLNFPFQVLEMLRKTQSEGKPSAKSVSKIGAPVTSVVNESCPTTVHACGQNMYNELGVVLVGDTALTQAPRKAFVHVDNLDGYGFVQAGAGNEHTVLLSQEGKVFAVGYNDNGQCGVASNAPVKETKQIALLDGEVISQIHVCNGAEHTLVVTKEGKLYSFGYNYRGQLGHGTNVSESVPRLVKSLQSRKVTLATCSYYHSLVLCSDGSLWSMGRGDSGQLGHRDTATEMTPRRVENAPKNIVGLSCGQYHSIITTYEGDVYVCGKNDYGQLGVNSTEATVKTLTKSPHLENVKQACCGYHHTLFLTHTGVVMGCGRNDYGQLGLGHTQSRVHVVQCVPGLRDKNITSLASGCYHSIAFTGNGMLYAFGRNNFGQLGTGDLDERLSPFPIDDFVGRRIVSVAAGFYHTLIVSCAADCKIDIPGADSAEVIYGPRVAGFESTEGASTVKGVAASPLTGGDIQDSATVASVPGAAVTVPMTNPFSTQPSLASRLSNVHNAQLQHQPGSGKGSVTNTPDDTGSADELADEPVRKGPNGRSPEQNKGGADTQACPVNDSSNLRTLSFVNDGKNPLYNCLGKRGAVAAMGDFSFRRSEPLSEFDWLACCASSNISMGDLLALLVERIAAYVAGDKKQEFATEVAHGEAEGHQVVWLTSVTKVLSCMINLLRGEILAAVRGRDCSADNEHSEPNYKLFSGTLEEHYGIVVMMIKMVDGLLQKHQSCLINVQRRSKVSPLDSASGLLLEIEGASAGFAQPADVVAHLLSLLSSENDAFAADGVLGSAAQDEALCSVLNRLHGDLLRMLLSACALLPVADSSGAAAPAASDLSPSSDRTSTELVAGGLFIKSLSNCIVTNFDVFCPTFESKFVQFKRLVTVVGERLSSGEGSTMGEDVDFRAVLMLIAHICSRFQSLPSTVELVATDVHCALLWTQEVLEVFNKLSITCTEHKLFGLHAATMARFKGDVSRCLGILEQSLGNLVKCVLPLIFRRDALASHEGTVALGKALIRSIFDAGQLVISSLSNEELLLRNVAASIVASNSSAVPLSIAAACNLLCDDINNLFKFGTVIPTILPSVILFALSYICTDEDSISSLNSASSSTSDMLNVLVTQIAGQNVTCVASAVDHMLDVLRGMLSCLDELRSSISQLQTLCSSLPDMIFKSHPSLCSSVADVTQPGMSSSPSTATLDTVAPAAMAGADATPALGPVPVPANSSGRGSKRPGGIASAEDADQDNSRSSSATKILGRNSVASTSTTGVFANATTTCGWFVRLTKLSVVLSSHIAAVLVLSGELSDIAKSQNSDPGGADNALVCHAMWRHLSASESASTICGSHCIAVEMSMFLEKHQYEKYSRGYSCGEHTNQEWCQSLRAKMLKSDPVYAMLLRVAQTPSSSVATSANSPYSAPIQLIHGIESVLFDMVYQLEFSSPVLLGAQSVRDVKMARGWKRISSIIKKLQSKRSTIISYLQPASGTVYFDNSSAANTPLRPSKLAANTPGSASSALSSTSPAYSSSPLVGGSPAVPLSAAPGVPAPTPVVEQMPLKWIDILHIVYSLVSLLHKLVGKLVPKYELCPSILPTGCKMSVSGDCTRARSLWRRALLVVLCANRWKNTRRIRGSKCIDSVIDFVEQSLDMSIYKALTDGSFVPSSEYSLPVASVIGADILATIPSNLFKQVLTHVGTAFQSGVLSHISNGLVQSRRHCAGLKEFLRLIQGASSGSGGMNAFTSATPAGTALALGKSDVLALFLETFRLKCEYNFYNAQQRYFSGAKETPGPNVQVGIAGRGMGGSDRSSDKSLLFPDRSAAPAVSSSSGSAIALYSDYVSCDVVGRQLTRLLESYIGDLVVNDEASRAHGLLSNSDLVFGSLCIKALEFFAMSDFRCLGALRLSQLCRHLATLFEQFEEHLAELQTNSVDDKPLSTSSSAGATAAAAIPTAAASATPGAVALTKTPASTSSTPGSSTAAVPVGPAPNPNPVPAPSVSISPAVSREKRKLFRRASTFIISLLETLGVCAGYLHDCLEYQLLAASHCKVLFETNSNIISSIQLARMVALGVSDNQDNGSNSGQGESKAPLADVPSEVDAVDGYRSFSKSKESVHSFWSGSKTAIPHSNNASSQKKRCQTLINTPMQFVKGMDGFILPEKSLITNIKGTDFTMVTWVYLSRKNTAHLGKCHYLFGKVHQNDGWPMVVLRAADMKLEVVYGKDLDLDRFTSQTSVPLASWVHVTVTSESKKFKLYINGVLDSQVSTSGNPKAISMPILIGSCPHGVKTRLDHVKDGFDGQLSSFKYYTRALSHIHVRIIYEQGPPELSEYREKWLLQLFASSVQLSTILRKCNNAPNVNCNSSTASSVAATKDTNVISIEQGAFHASTKVLMALLISESSTTANTCPVATPQSASSSMCNNKLRVAALRALEAALLTGGVKNILLPGGSAKQPITIMNAAFLTEFTSFEEKLVAFFIKMLGLCWLPGLIAAGDLSGQLSSKSAASSPFISGLSEQMLALLSCVPKFIMGNMSDVCTDSAAGSAAGLSANQSMPSIHRLVVREDLNSEFCHMLNSMLRNLSNDNSVWKSAISSVARQLLCGSDSLLGAGAEGGVEKSVNSLGVSVFLGDMCAGFYLGCDVEGYFCDNRAKLLSVHPTNGTVTLLMWNRASTQRQLMTVRLTDISACLASNASGAFKSGNSSDASVVNPQPLVQLSSSSMSAVLDMLDTLAPHLQLLRSDIACIYRPEHVFLRQVFIKALRPVEILVFYQLLRFVLSHLGSVDDQGLCAEIFQRKNLYLVIIQLSSRVLHPQGVLQDVTDVFRGLVTLWVKCARYITSLPADCGQHEFPGRENEKAFVDFVTKQMGVSVSMDSFQPSSESDLEDAAWLSAITSGGSGLSSGGSVSNTFSNPDNVKLLKLGLFSEVIHCGSCGVGSDCSSFHEQVGAEIPSNNVNDINDLTESEYGYMLRLTYNIRRGLILHCREVLTKLFVAQKNFEATFVPLAPPLKMMIWHEMSYMQSVMKPNTGTCLALDNICNFLKSTQKLEASQGLSASLRYLTCSFFQASATKVIGNVLETTDLFYRQLLAAHLWLDFNVGSAFEVELCVHLLKVILSSLMFVESGVVELNLLQLCRHTLYRLLFRLMNADAGGAPSIVNMTDVVELSRCKSFCEIRCRAIDQLMRERGNASSQFSELSQALTYLASGLELLQRVCSTAWNTPCLGQGVIKPVVGATVSNAISVISCVKPASPRISNIKANSADIDLTQCVNKLANLISTNPGPESNSGTTSPAKPNGVTNNPIVEIALSSQLVPLTTSTSSGSSSTDYNYYETIYQGTCLKITQSGLIPNCIYSIKCRVYTNTAGENSSDIDVGITQWSDPIEFRTDYGGLSGLSGVAALASLTTNMTFGFDPLKCGPDILLGSDGLTASYAGDDCWSTVLGTHSYTSGVVTWNIRVAQSSTAYIFVGVATSAADLHTFLGGCAHSWGFIGEQALYHNREKVKVYGDAFNAGDIVGVTLDLDAGTLSFAINGKSQGTAFDQIYGEFFPAVAFYNVGQEVEILFEGYHASAGHESAVVPCSPLYVNIAESGVILELLMCLYNISYHFSYQLLGDLAQQCNSFCDGSFERVLTVSGKWITMCTSNGSPLLEMLQMNVGERYRTPCGIGRVLGVQYGRVWFEFGDATERKNASLGTPTEGEKSSTVWYYTVQQIISAKERGFYLRTSYYTPSGSSSKKYSAGGNSLHYDAASLYEIFTPGMWTEQMDRVIVKFLQSLQTAATAGDSSEKAIESPWDVSADLITSEFRNLQSKLTKIVMSNSALSHHWGISGPKRRAVTARIVLLRYINKLMEHNLSLLISDSLGSSLDASPITNQHLASLRRSYDDYQPHTTTLLSSTCKVSTGPDSGGEISDSASPISGPATQPHVVVRSDGHVVWPIVNLSWEACLATSTPAASTAATNTSDINTSLPQFYGGSVRPEATFAVAPLLFFKPALFGDIKLRHFAEIVNKSAAKAAKTEDDYDYPDDLPQVKLNRFTSFRAKEASEFLKIPGDDLLFSSLFCQLWQEMRQHSQEKVRICYAHPMDDGQSRTFKVKFEAEGVDDYGGPYREIFQQICNELQCADPSSSGQTSGNDNGGTEKKLQSPTRCFLPLLCPTKNWSIANDTSGTTESEDGDSGDFTSSGPQETKYTYTLNPAASSDVLMDLFRFLGQFIGMAIRSKITLEFVFPTFIWKSLVRDPLCERDIEGFDSSAYNVIQQLGCLYGKYQNPLEAPEQREVFREDLMSILQDIRWVCSRTDGIVVELIPNGAAIVVTLDELPLYLKRYIDCRLTECFSQLESMRSGLISVIPESALSLLCGEELQRIVCGSSIIDVERLKLNTEYDDNVSAVDMHVIMFWEVLTSFSEAEKSLFLRFVWARPTLPPNQLEFNQKMKIQSAICDDAAANPDTYLPKAHTCFFSLNLPKYSCKEIMAEKLLYAIKHCTEMDADFKLTDSHVTGWGNALPATTVVNSSTLATGMNSSTDSMDLNGNR